ncbi:serine/threonine protein kinase [Saccharothrix australiensis]|uniref:non-specific serine/threonine protein kinase n=1 Tax=Saccharothrix australiensis TaxID=2072 RepID=A0A495W4Q6_9PSEU|nr:serine/threonine-protein kinase [Saccharothrix australiensis]RKT56656.1 serine/threonine-protein kinase [Saccharothrix australiensis]
MIGEVVKGRYEVLSTLGSGGMGAVFVALDLHKGRKKVVLKTPLVSLGTERQPTTDLQRHLNRFAREAAFLCRIRHPNVARGYDHGHHGKVPYLVMDWVNGYGLDRFLEDNPPLPTEAVAAVVAQIAEALAATHAEDVVHRDLKPGNVMLSHAGVVYLIDFGLAKPMDPDVTKLTGTEHSPGTEEYMTPEQFGSGDDICPQTDLYALGFMTYIMLTGVPPFAGSKTGISWKEHHLHTRPARPDRKGDPIPDALADLVLHLLEKRVSDRPADAREVVDRLEPFLPEPGSAAPFPSLKPDPTRVYRHPGETRPPDAPPVAPDPVRSAVTVRRSGPALSRREIPALVEEALAAASKDPTGGRLRLERLLKQASGKFGAFDVAVEPIRQALGDLDNRRVD